MHCSATEWSRAKENDETFASEEQGEMETMILLRERERGSGTGRNGSDDIIERE